MAINGTVVQAIYATSAGNSITAEAANGWATPTDGNLLICVASYRVNSATVNAPDWAGVGFTAIQSDYTSNGGGRGAIAWKVSDGTESSIVFSAHASDIFQSYSIAVLEFDATDLDLSAVEASVENTASIVDVNDQTVSTGSVANTTADALSIAFLCIANDNLWNTTGPSIDGSYALQSDDPTTGANCAPYVASKVLASAASQSANWSTTDTGGYAYAGLVIFGGSAPAPAVTFDASTKTISASTTTSLVVTASPVFAGAITTITAPGGDTITAAVSPAATTSSATFAIPSVAQFASGGTMNNTRMGAAGSWSVTDGADSATASLTIQPPTGYFLRTLTATTGAIPVDITGEAIGDDILAWGDDLNDVDTLGDVNVSAMPTTVNYRWYDISGTAAWQADGDITVAADVVLTATTDAVTYATGANVVISLDPDNVEAPDAMTLAGVNVFGDFTATGTTGGTLVAPVTSDFTEALGTFNAVRWFTFLDLVVGFAAAADSTVQIQIIGPTGANVSGGTEWHGTVGDTPEGFLAGYAEGDLWYLTSPANDIASIDNGIITALAAVGALNLWVYTAGAWSDEGQILVHLGSVANHIVRTGAFITIAPVFAGNDGNAVFTLHAGTLPTGITIASGTGIISGTAPIDLVAYPETFGSLVIRMTDGAVTADSNVFSITVRSLKTGELAILRPIAGAVASSTTKRISK